MRRNFVSGVVEGFYGRPWSASQRLNLFQRLDYLGLNTYLYAPKDDMKHRQLWRDLYSKEEAIQLKYLIDTSKNHNITFVYAISPGVDITFSDTNETFLLKQKMHQVLQLGCEAFSLLFDDISTNLCDLDKGRFVSLANAQVTLTNDIYDYLKQPRFFLFCPTEYCATRAIPCVIQSEYLSTIGNTLKPEIDIMWTGPKVISKFITLESIIELCDVLKRKPVIWDNIHANDYDQKRLFLGPFCGRSTELIPYLRGILTNPNCEFEANFVAIHTLAQWVRSTNREIDNQQATEYSPSQALGLALKDWLEVLYQNNKDVVPENDSSTSGSSVTESRLSTVTVVSVPIKSAASQTFSLEHTSAASKVIAPIIKYPEDKSVDEILSSSAQNIAISGLTCSETPSLVPGISTPTKEMTKDSPGGHCKTCYKPFSTSFAVGQKCSCLIECGNKSGVVLALANQNEMDTMDNIVNVFSLIPMETEDNQSDPENIIDPMAMQVDSVEENNFEIMDVIDEANNAKIDREISKNSLSLNAEESEMDETISNESLNLPERAVGIKVPKLTTEDLNLLVHMFFLPYEHGPLAVKMLQLMHWIRCYAVSMHDGSRDNEVSSAKKVTNECSDNKYLNQPVLSLEWHQKAKEFSHQVELVRNMVDRLCAIPNRSVLFDLYPYIQELRHVLGTLNSYVKWMGSTSGLKEPFLSDDHEPFMFMGGVTSELQRMFPLEGSNDLFPNHASFPQNPLRHGWSLSGTEEAGPTGVCNRTHEDVHIANNINIESLPLLTTVLLLRPYFHSDKKNLYDISRELLYDQLSKNPEVNEDDLKELNSSTFRDLAGDRYLGHFLEFCPESCIILENEHGRILGYVLGSSKVKEIYKFRQDVYLEKMRVKYTSQFNSLSQGGLNKSVVKTLMDGLFNQALYDNFPIKDRPQVLVHLNVMDGCNTPNSDTVDTLSRRLLASICSALTTPSTETIDDHDLKSPSVSRSHEGVLNGNHVSQESTCSVTTAELGGSAAFPMAVCCEVDSLNESYEAFCVRCGFSRCDRGGDGATISFMSRYV